MAGSNAATATSSKLESSPHAKAAAPRSLGYRWRTASTPTWCANGSSRSGAALCRPTRLASGALHCRAKKNRQAASWPYLISLQTLSQFSMDVRLTLRLECSVNAETPPVRRHPAGACVRGQYASPLARRHVRCRNTRASEGQLHRTGVDPTRAGWERWRGALHPRGLHEGTAG